MIIITITATKKKSEKEKKKKKESSEDYHTYSHAKKLHKSLANFNVYFLDIDGNLTIVRKRKRILLNQLFYLCFVCF